MEEIKNKNYNNISNPITPTGTNYIYKDYWNSEDFKKWNELARREYHGQRINFYFGY